jgi:hypothetical protein
MLHYYPRHVSGINMPIFRRKDCIHTASGIFALYERLHSTQVESGLTSQPVYCADESEDTRCCCPLSTCVLCRRLQRAKISDATVRSQPVYCADVYRERRYQMLQSALNLCTVQTFTESEDIRCCSPLSTCVLCRCLQRAKRPDAV